MKISLKAFFLTVVIMLLLFNPIMARAISPDDSLTKAKAGLCYVQGDCYGSIFIDFFTDGDCFVSMTTACDCNSNCCTAVVQLCPTNSGYVIYVDMVGCPVT